MSPSGQHRTEPEVPARALGVRGLLQMMWRMAGAPQHLGIPTWDDEAPSMQLPRRCAQGTTMCSLAGWHRFCEARGTVQAV